MNKHIVFYRMTSDTGYAPCVADGMLSLACCKGGTKTGVSRGMRWEIGRKLKDETWDQKDAIYVVGVARSAIVYIARIDRVIAAGEYFSHEDYKSRGDCIYEVRDRPVRELKGKAFFFARNDKNPEFHGPEAHDDHIRDETGGYVLLSTRFAYYGKGSESPAFSGFEDVIPPYRGHRAYSTGEDGFQEAEAFLARYWADEKPYCRPEAREGRKKRGKCGC